MVATPTVTRPTADMPFVIEADIVRGHKRLLYLGTVVTGAGPREVEFSSVVCDAFGANVVKLIDLYEQRGAEIQRLKDEIEALRQGQTTVPPWRRNDKKNAVTKQDAP